VTSKFLEIINIWETVQEMLLLQATDRPK